MASISEIARATCADKGSGVWPPFFTGVFLKRRLYKPIVALPVYTDIRILY